MTGARVVGGRERGGAKLRCTSNCQRFWVATGKGKVCGRNTKDVIRSLEFRNNETIFLVTQTRGRNDMSELDSYLPHVAFLSVQAGK